MSSHSIVIFLGLLVLNIQNVIGHGMLMDPINRGSMWRQGYPTPINYDDNGNYCGGYGMQWNVNDGKCGACGDDYSLSQPRPNENTGIYGTGIVVATYTAGSVLDLTVRITANHRGRFQFNICPLTNGPEEIETENCFDEYPLVVDEDGSTWWTLDSSEVGDFTITVKLPDSLTCDRCVLRWHWTTGNNWGECDGSEKVGKIGCGPQETFRTCSDISIIP